MSVPGNGSYNAKIMFIGEAPGRSEDLRGRPFAGSAGKKLDDALKSAGLSSKFSQMSRGNQELRYQSAVLL